MEEENGHAGGEGDRIRFLLNKQELDGLTGDEKIELRELIKTISDRPNLGLFSF